MTADRFKLTRNCKLNDETTIQAGTVVRLLQVVGTRALIQIPSGGGVQKIVDPQDLQLYGPPMWCYDTEYELDEVDLNEVSEEKEDFEIYSS